MLEEYEDVITVQDLRDILGVGRNVAYALLKEGEVPAFRIGRNWKIPKESVIHYISRWKNTGV